jgi:hypothetical protein
LKGKEVKAGGREQQIEKREKIINNLRREIK